MSKPIIEEHHSTVPFGSGSLDLAITTERAGVYYGEFPVVLSRVLTFKAGSEPAVSVSDFSDLEMIANRHGFDCQKEIASRPVDFAHLVVDLKGLGAVLRPTWRYQFFQDRYGIDLLANQPRVEAESLRFLAVNLHVEETPHVVKDVTLSLVDFSLSVKDLIRLQ